MSESDKKYKIEFLNKDGTVKKTEHTNSLKTFSKSNNLNYYIVRKLLNDEYKTKKRGQHKYGQELSKILKITDKKVDFSMLLN